MERGAHHIILHTPYVTCDGTLGEGEQAEEEDEEERSHQWWPPVPSLQGRSGRRTGTTRKCTTSPKPAPRCPSAKNGWCERSGGSSRQKLALNSQKLAFLLESMMVCLGICRMSCSAIHRRVLRTGGRGGRGSTHWLHSGRCSGHTDPAPTPHRREPIRGSACCSSDVVAVSRRLLSCLQKQNHFQVKDRAASWADFPLFGTKMY